MKKVKNLNKVDKTEMFVIMADNGNGDIAFYSGQHGWNAIDKYAFPGNNPDEILVYETLAEAVSDFEKVKSNFDFHVEIRCVSAITKQYIEFTLDQ